MTDSAFNEAWASHTFRASDFMEAICALGHRFMGSEGERKVREYLLRELHNQGLEECEAEAMDYLGYRTERAAIRVVFPEDLSIPCDDLGLSGLTPEGGTEAELVYAGEGEDDDYAALAKERGGCIGKIVLADAFKSYQAVPRAEENWAVGFIMGTRLEEEAVRVGVTNLSGVPGRIPAVAVAPSQSRRLQTLLENGPVHVRLEVTGEYRADTSQIISGTVRGTETPEETVFVVSHFDSHRMGPHAADNASGCGALLDLAGFFQSARPRRSIRFLGFPGEEFGFLGARRYVARHAQEMNRAKAVVNLDGMISCKEGRTNAEYTEETKSLAERVAEEHGIPITQWSCPPHAYSDHYEFQKEGVPVVWFFELDDYYHTELDVPENIDKNRFEKHTKAYADVIWSLAQD